MRATNTYMTDISTDGNGTFVTNDGLDECGCTGPS